MITQLMEQMETGYTRAKRPRYDHAWYGASARIVPKETVMVRLKYKRVPLGKLPVHRGTRVKATDGRAGRVDEFLADSDTGHITYLVLQEGHLWDPKDVTIPVSEISHVNEDVVYLKLDKRTIASLPAVPLSWRSGWKGVYIWETDLIQRTLTEEVMEWLAAATVAKKGVENATSH